VKPILFSTPMVQAILDGRKTQTRRIIKGDYAQIGSCPWTDGGFSEYHKNGACRCRNGIKPKYQIGDILYVKETYGLAPNEKLVNIPAQDIIFKTDKDAHRVKKWKPSIFMARIYARLFLRVTNVGVERLQDISEDDAIDEGIEQTQQFSGMRLLFKDYSKKDEWLEIPTDSYQTLWDSINKEPEKQWEANPYVFVYEFEKITKEEAIK
jgi:hypothetical protein